MMQGWLEDFHKETDRQERNEKIKLIAGYVIAVVAGWVIGIIAGMLIYG